MLPSGKSVVTILNGSITTDTSDVWHFEGPVAFDAYGSTSSGSGAAQILIQVSNTNLSATFKTAVTIDLTLGTTVTSDGYYVEGEWAYVRAKVASISGTGASVTVKAMANGGKEGSGSWTI